MKRIPWRGLLYAVVLLYLFLDLKACNGPIKRTMLSRRDATLEAARENKWVAVVNREPITRDQLDLAVYRHLYQRGKLDDEIPDKNEDMIRRAVLNSLIDDTLVRQYAEGDQFRAPEDEIERFIESWESQFASEEEMEERSALQGLPPRERREELSRIWSHKKWLERRIEPGIAVTDAEVRSWYEENRESGEGFVEPAKVRARHIFLSTVETDDEKREETIREIRRRIAEGESTFEEEAKAFSEDERSKKWGGDLNWFARDRMPEDFAEAVFALDPGDLSEPFRTKIGWHIVEVVERREERPREFGEMAEEIRLHLENQRAAETVQVLMGKLRKVANIRLFLENV